ncbi:MAG: oligosaccharide flippase family protein [Vicinamibacterales bacterium]
MLYRAGSDLLAKGAMFIVTVVAARRLSRVDFALFALASTLGWLASVAADFGLQMHLARAVAQAPRSGRALLARWWPVRVGTGVGALAVAVVTLPFTGAAATWPAWLFLLAYAANGATEFLYYFFRGCGRTDLESTLTLVQRGAMLLLALGALAVAPGAGWLAVAMLVPAVLGLAAALVLARSMRMADRAETIPSIPRGQAYVRDVAPIGLGILLSALYFRIDVFLLQHWSGDAAVGVYNAMFRLVEALRLFPAAVLAVALPTLARADDRGPLTALATPMSVAALAAAAVGWAVAPWLVRALYGAAFLDGVPALRVLLLSLPLMALNYALTHQLIGWHGHRAYAATCAAALAVNLFLNWRWIPAIGMRGAAWSTLWTEVVLTCGCLIALRQFSAGTSARSTSGMLEAES